MYGKRENGQRANQEGLPAHTPRTAENSAQAPAPLVNWAVVGGFIKDVGFPIFVAVYLLLQLATLSPKVDRMIGVLERIDASHTQMLWILRQDRNR